MTDCSSFYSEEEVRNAATLIRPVLNQMIKNPNPDIELILKGKDEVLNRYQPIFAPGQVGSMSKEDYLSFLTFNNNKHWKALQRIGPMQTIDMNSLREALSILVDENQGIKERLDIILPNSGALIPWFGRATITPILMISYPEKYGVLNNPTEAGLRKIGLWPAFDKNVNFADKYYEANCLLNCLAAELEIDLWTLDAVWWALPADEDGDKDELPTGNYGEYLPSDDKDTTRFGLERYLHEFLRDNWEKIPDFKDWSLYEVDGDQVGFKYRTGSVGEIDLLARHKTSSKWLIIELKRNQSSDDTVGQVLRYMGWVSRDLAEKDDKVQGLIISHKTDRKLDYALEHTQSVEIMLYDVKFILQKAIK